jgi:hypothetical protein
MNMLMQGSIVRSENYINPPPPSENDIFPPLDSHHGLFTIFLCRRSAIRIEL